MFVGIAGFYFLGTSPEGIRKANDAANSAKVRGEGAKEVHFCTDVARQ